MSQHQPQHCECGRGYKELALFRQANRSSSVCYGRKALRAWSRSWPLCVCRMPEPVAAESVGTSSLMHSFVSRHQRPFECPLLPCTQHRLCLAHKTKCW